MIPLEFTDFFVWGAIGNELEEEEEEEWIDKELRKKKKDDRR